MHGHSLHMLLLAQNLAGCAYFLSHSVNRMAKLKRACTAVLLMTGSLPGIQMNIQMNYKQAIVPFTRPAGGGGGGDGMTTLMCFLPLSLCFFAATTRFLALWMRSHRISEQTRTHERARMHAYAMHTQFHKCLDTSQGGGHRCA